jgi:hypothetical protein
VADSTIADTWARLVRAGLSVTSDVGFRALDIGTRYAAEMIDAATSKDRVNGAALARNLASELLALPGLGLAQFAAALDPPPAHAADPPISESVDGRRVVFPLRVLEAKQGLVVYSVPREPAQAWLDTRHQGDLIVADLGHGRAALEIFVVDYLAADLGVYRELGVGLFVAPKRRPSHVGLAVLDEPVTGHFACHAGVQIWGDPKTEQGLQFDERPATLACTLVRSGSNTHVLTITLPRGGSGVSTGIPLTLYTRLPAGLHMSFLERSGRGERMRAGGDGVSLVIHDATDPLSKHLQSLGLPGDARPMFHAWTEHMRVQVSAPVLVA